MFPIRESPVHIVECTRGLMFSNEMSPAFPLGILNILLVYIKSLITRWRSAEGDGIPSRLPSGRLSYLLAWILKQRLDKSVRAVLQKRDPPWVWVALCHVAHWIKEKANKVPAIMAPLCTSRGYNTTSCFPISQSPLEPFLLAPAVSSPWWWTVTSHCGPK